MNRNIPYFKLRTKISKENSLGKNIDMKAEQTIFSNSTPVSKYGFGILHKGLSSSNYRELTKLYGIAKLKRLEARLKELSFFNN
ncbi:hypothetical protein CC99x_007540 [Candidatus Berkiella cookevillensis]|uniref:Uncharacterized protein n=2 Tax=Candidatus Berkiella cookevillensis TaxID=437022 RepID=A0AAE3HS90_9GAMM|nr:hypothetical protein [Candidatus Berkiella cookevillensis]MCS5708755.1 hypothetical protein [Candidatus Berkiella cookevillensis]